MIERICETCGKAFSIYPSILKSRPARFCSHKCHGIWLSEHQIGEANPNWHGGITKRICEICGKEFDNPPSSQARFCSKTCKGAWMSNTRQGAKSPNWKGGLATVTCKNCKKEFNIAPSEIKRDRGIFCSFECRGIWMAEHTSGTNSWNWKGGKSFEPYPLAFNKAFKRKIKERDNHICAICQEKGDCVHHINYKKDDTTPQNCITLCRSCHSTTNSNRKHWQSLLEKIMRIRYENNARDGSPVPQRRIELHSLPPA